MRPAYWLRAKRALARRDPTLAAIMRAHAGVFLVRRGEPFMTLARAIVGQQISVRAAQSVWDRFLQRAPDVTPAQVLALEHAALRACGLSARKAEYIADLAQHFADGTLHVQHWPEMDDEAVIAALVQVRGIGRWTAEMFLIFNLLRPDVLPLDDLGLQKAIRGAYFNGRRATPARMRRLAANWAPWRSVATWYLWRSLDPVPVEY
ncbi:MAG: DNA-3-methyladenine glycosylase [Betaproteobacteria bacterium SG8_39]|jgi:DNA-3-methyladenine glycosylase II|nr:MAG: DNA-3-methyladenine glycosylase [Betaproteobacteria bacterium SG8_39]